MLQFTQLLALAAASVLTITAYAHALHCYNCYAWEGSPFHDEACRLDGMDSISCDPASANSLVYGPYTRTILNMTLASTNLDPRAAYTPVCLKVGGTATTDVPVVVRTCLVVIMDEEFDGACGTSEAPLWADFPGWVGVVKAGVRIWVTTQDNSNGDSAAGGCSASYPNANRPSP